MSWDYLDLLAELIRIPSVNPMGQPLSDPRFGEARLSCFLEDRFRELGLDVERQEAEPGRENVVARLEGTTSPDSGGRSLLIDVHQDTVGGSGMTVEPFTPKVDEGRVYGRGACDVKGSLAVVLGVLSNLVRERPPEMPTIFVACTVNEENGFTGARRLAESWTHGRSALFSRKPDAAIVAEPTELNVVVAHKGVVRWRCHATGRAAHSSQPEAGENAIYKMARILAILEEYAANLADARGNHPLVGSATLSVGTIAGGTGVNTVPDRCTIEIDRRLLPDEDPRDAFQQVHQCVADAVDAGDAPHHDEPFLLAGGLTDECNGNLAAQLQAVASRLNIPCRPIGVSYGTDAWAISAAGVPTVVFGPGSIRQAHTADEWIAIDQLHGAGAILQQFCSHKAD